MLNYYDKLKGKAKTNLLNITYFNMLLGYLISMFEYKNLPDTLPHEYLETYLIIDGFVGIGKPDNKNIYCTSGGITGTNGYPFPNFGKFFNGSVVGHGTIEGEIGKTVAIGYNNFTKTPDFLLTHFADTFTEIDKSIDNNILYSRYLPIPVVKNSKMKDTIDIAIRRMRDGEQTCVIADELEKEKFLDDNFKALEIENFSDVDKIDKLQYLLKAHDDTLRRFTTYYGQALQNSPKQAQALNAELHGNDSYSFIHPLERLKCRQKMVEQINDIFGTNISVDFSEIWKKEYVKYMKEDENNVV